MTCFYCGTELPAGAMFCGECGRPVNTKGGRSPRSAKTPTAGPPEAGAPEQQAVEPGAVALVSVESGPLAAQGPSSGDALTPAAEEESAVAEHASGTVAEPEFGTTPAGEPTAGPDFAAGAEPTAAEPTAEAEPVHAEESGAAVDPVPPPAPQPASEREAAPAPAPEPEVLVDPLAQPVSVPAPAAEPASPSPWEPTAASHGERGSPPVGTRPALPGEPAPADSAAGSAPAETCAQCGAPLAASDIFCPECGFVRQRASTRARPSDTNVLDPFPWGLPRPPQPVAPVHPAAVLEPDEPARAPAADASAKPFAEIADVAETRLVPRGTRGERFILQFSTGESVSVTGTGLIGRNPVPEPGEYFDTLVAVVDPGRSVSKTHLEFGQDGTSFWVSDRYSGNGTVVREPDSEPRRCDAGKRYRVARGARVEIGEQFFIVS
ncbi:hypothetical protein BH09ACT5_BH09ACT5_07610 [soil metagenome]